MEEDFETDITNLFQDFNINYKDKELIEQKVKINEIIEKKIKH